MTLELGAAERFEDDAVAGSEEFEQAVYSTKCAAGGDTAMLHFY